MSDFELFVCILLALVACLLINEFIGFENDECFINRVKKFFGIK